MIHRFGRHAGTIASNAPINRASTRNGVPRYIIDPDTSTTNRAATTDATPAAATGTSHRRGTSHTTTGHAR